jgi:DNA-directed RNA polymerase subunit beta'
MGADPLALLQRLRALPGGEALRLTPLSPEEVRLGSRGALKSAKALDSRTGRPHRGGLFCARLFGPLVDLECLCGLYRGEAYRGLTCGECGVEVLESSVRGERFAHLELCVPVPHPWFARCLGALLGLGERELNEALQDRFQLWYERVYPEVHRRYQAGERPSDHPAWGELLELAGLSALGGPLAERPLGEVSWGEILLALLRESPLAEHAARVREAGPSPEARLLEELDEAGCRPERLLLTALPVLPPALRPLSPDARGRLRPGGLNLAYEAVFHRNHRLRRLRELNAPWVLSYNEELMLQRAVYALFDGGAAGRARRPAAVGEARSLYERLAAAIDALFGGGEGAAGRLALELRALAIGAAPSPAPGAAAEAGGAPPLAAQLGTQPRPSGS